VSFGVSPPGSGLPDLPCPSGNIKTPFRRVLLAYSIERIKFRSEGDIPRRSLQQKFKRTNGRLVSKHLKALVLEGWLSERTKSRGVYATRYALGRRFNRSRKLREEWLQLSTRLFGNPGLLSGLFSRDAFGPNFLGLNGLLVVSTLDNSKRPLSVKELHQYLGFFMSRQTIRNVLLKLAEQSPALAINVDGFWDSPKDLSLALEIYEKTKGARARSKKTDRMISRERAKHRLRVKGSVLTPAEERRLKTSCIRNKTHKKPFQIEHFPPRKFLRKWQQTDHIDLSWGICTKCNNKYGQWVKKHAAPKLDRSTPIRITIKAGLDVRRAVLAHLETSLRQFFQSVDKGDDVKALRLIADAYRLWLAVTKNEIPLHVTRIRADGSVRTKFVDIGKSVRKGTGEIGKRKVSSNLTRDWPDGPARRFLNKWKV